MWSPVEVRAPASGHSEPRLLLPLAFGLARANRPFNLLVVTPHAPLMTSLFAPSASFAPMRFDPRVHVCSRVFAWVPRAEKKVANTRHAARIARRQPTCPRVHVRCNAVPVRWRAVHVHKKRSAPICASVVSALAPSPSRPQSEARPSGSVPSLPSHFAPLFAPFALLCAFHEKASLSQGHLGGQR
jgi:hypothetical protein